MEHNDAIYSPNSYSRLYFQNDGNLVLYLRANNATSNWHASNTIWKTDTEDEDGESVYLTNSGDLRLYDDENEVLFASNSNSGTAPFKLLVDDEGYAHIVDATGIFVWITDEKYLPTPYPTVDPTIFPTESPSLFPTKYPTPSPTKHTFEINLDVLINVQGGDEMNISGCTCICIQPLSN